MAHTMLATTRGSLLALAVLPLLVGGCGGDGSTGNGIFGGSGQSVVTQPNATPQSLTSGTTSAGLQPNAVPLSAPGGASGGVKAGQAITEAATTPNGPLAPLSGTYAGIWRLVPSAATPAKEATPAKSASATGGVVTMKLSYPKHASKTVLGDVSGTWADASRGGIGRISGTIDKIGLPNEPNAVHVVGKILFPGGKSHPLVVELSEETVGQLGGRDADDAIFLKKTR